MSIGREGIHKHGQAAADGTQDRLDAAVNNIAQIDEGPSFCSNPADYIWRYGGKKQTLVPYHCVEQLDTSLQNHEESEFPHPRNIRWEIHDVFIVEGTLRTGESNVLVRRCFYIEDTTWAILLGEGYDRSGDMVKRYMLSKNAVLETSRHGRWYS